MISKSITTEELRKELERRERIENTRPKLVENPNLQSIIDYCEDYMETIKRERYELKDFRDYLYESVMITLYGKDVFDYINQVIR